MVQSQASLLQRILSVTDRRLHSSTSEHQPLQQRVASQSVCTMQPCASYFAAGKEPWDVSLAQQAGLNAATHVVLSRYNWDWLLSDVNATLLTLRCNVGEVLHDLQIANIGFRYSWMHS